MTSGVYKIFIGAQYFYLGADENIEEAVDNFIKDVTKGNTTEFISRLYAELPSISYEIVKECHPDHLNVCLNMEALKTENNKLQLNKIKTKAIPSYRLVNTWFDHSTLHIMELLNYEKQGYTELARDYKLLKQELRKPKKGFFSRKSN